MNLSNPSLGKEVEIIPDKLYWLSSKAPPKNQSNSFFFNIDEDLVYEPFFADFGPLNMGKVCRFVVELDKLLKDVKYGKCKFYHHTSLESDKRANAAYLMGAYQVIMLNRTAEEAWQPFADARISFVDFRDASYTNCTYKCSILDCLRGLDYGIRLEWFNLKTFNLKEYEHYEKVENGDLNWIIPGKFVAFSGPSGQPRDPDGYRRFTPEDYVPIFKRLGVTLVIRLNNKQYDKERFTKNGIKHLDLYFLDGSCPSEEIIQTFLNAVEQEKGAVAVHCKAGLGRTGSLIAAYAMKHYKFAGPDFIGWIRICRPGSILGPQQQFLCDIEPRMHKLGEKSPIRRQVSSQIQGFWERRDGSEVKSLVMSPLDKKIAKYGDEGQGNKLVGAKQKVMLKESTQETAESLGEIPSDDEESTINLPERGEKFFRGGKSHKFGTSGFVGSTSFTRPQHSRFRSVNL